MNILGINFGGHDTSATIIKNGEIIAACEQERYDGIKHSRKFPIDAINDCLKISNLNLKEIDLVSYGMDNELKLNELYYKRFINDEKNINFLIEDIDRIYKRQNIKDFIFKMLPGIKKIEFQNHHKCHLASSFYPSNFKKALITSYDGIGEINSALFGIGNNKSIKIINDENKFPHSLGLIYSAITFYLGWKHHCDEGIIMGLAPYGNPNSKIPSVNKSYIQVFRDIIKIDKKNPLKYLINKDWISYHLERNKWVSEKFINVFGKKRNWKDKLSIHHKNIAAALQKRLEEVVLTQLKYLKNKYKCENLCISGGVGLNCSLNGKISASNIFKKIFVQPASGDAGISYGASLLGYYNQKKNKSKTVKNLNSFYLGFRETKKETLKNLKKLKVKYTDYDKDIFKITAKKLYAGNIVAWFQDAAEFGPRALGNRSILCKPYPKSMRDYINKKVKFREEFRPFAPAVLNEYRKRYFDINQDSEHMLIACNANKKNKNSISAVVHVDNTCRVQTVTTKSNKKFYKLLKEFNKYSNIPVLLNTSFNIKGMPIVNNSIDAINCFLKYKIDYLVINNFLIEK